jgi:hypothetical protein
MVWSAPTVSRSAANGETATEDGIDDIEENVAKNSADRLSALFFAESSQI